MALTLKALIKGYNFDSLDHQIQNNLEELLRRLQALEQSYGHPLSITSGLRTIADQIRIYTAKGITDKSKIPMKSRHLFGAAADLADYDGALKKWALANVSQLEKLGFWCEDTASTPTWLHVQINPSASGARFFKP